MPDETARAGRKPRYRGDQVITVIAATNPKKAGKKNYDRFAAMAAISAPITIEKAVAAGATMGDIAYDAKKGYISVGP